VLCINILICLKIVRPPGDEWLITNAQVEAYIPDVNTEVVGLQELVTLSNREYMVVKNPMDKDGKIQFGKREIRRKAQFLQPGELKEGKYEINVITAEQALVVKALEVVSEDSTGAMVTRKPGERWLVYGPNEYQPRLETAVDKQINAYFKVGSFPIFQLDKVIFYILAIAISLGIFYFMF